MHHILRYTLFALIPFFLSCERIEPSASTQPTAGSKDFWIDRCEIKYQSKPISINSGIGDIINIFGPFDRFSDVGYRYFWDSIGLQITTHPNSNLVNAIDINFNRTESLMEQILKKSGTREDLLKLDKKQANLPKGFFHGELVLEGAPIEKNIDFDKVNKIREQYFKSQKGSDAHSIPIQQSWSSSRYAFERNCTNGNHLRFIFTLLTGEDIAPNQLESLTISSDNVNDDAETNSNEY